MALPQTLSEALVLVTYVSSWEDVPVEMIVSGGPWARIGTVDGINICVEDDQFDFCDAEGDTIRFNLTATIS